MIKLANGLRSLGHSGGAIGMNGMLEILPDLDCVVVILANVDPPAAGRVSGLITEGLTRTLPDDVCWAYFLS